MGKPFLLLLERKLIPDLAFGSALATSIPSWIDAWIKVPTWLGCFDSRSCGQDKTTDDTLTFTQLSPWMNASNWASVKAFGPKASGGVRYEHTSTSSHSSSSMLGCNNYNTQVCHTRGLWFGVWGLGFGVWEIGRASCRER